MECLGIIHTSQLRKNRSNVSCSRLDLRVSPRPTGPFVTSLFRSLKTIETTTTETTTGDVARSGERLLDRGANLSGGRRVWIRRALRAPRSVGRIGARSFFGGASVGRYVYMCLCFNQGIDAKKQLQQIMAATNKEVVDTVVDIK